MWYTLPFTSSEITAFKDISLAISAMATGCAAVYTARIANKGLSSWKDEKRFADRFQLAREIVETSYKASEVAFRLSTPTYILSLQNLSKRLPSEKIEPLTELSDKLSSLHIQARALYGAEESQPVKDYISAIKAILIVCNTFINDYKQMDELDKHLKAGNDKRVGIIEIELDYYTEQVNLSKVHLISKPIIEQLKIENGFRSYGLKKIVEDSLSKGIKIGVVYEIEQSTLDELVQSMQLYLSH